jgi:hypothetical protein
MQQTPRSDHEVRIEAARGEIDATKQLERERFIRRAKVHAVAFVLAFVFTAGVALLGIVLWVRPDALVALVLVSLFSGLVFVACFAGVRILILHKLTNDYANRDDDPGMHHHLAKSIAYGFVALVLALLIAGLIVNVASADFF